MLSTIRARLHPSGAITIHQRPSWLARLFGAVETDREVEYAGGVWVDAYGRYVGYAATQAIERAVSR